MSDETTMGAAGQNGDETEHEDIMHRILEYQRQLREGDPPPPPTSTMPERPLMDFAAAEALSAETADLVDLTAAEAALAAETRPAPVLSDEGPPSDRTEGEEEQPAVPPVVRLVEEPSSATPPPGGVWAVPPPPAQDDRGETAARVAELEAALRRVSDTITELRQRFQDMAVASDERLAELEEILARAQRATRV
jgi:hypothetical protein